MPSIDLEHLVAESDTVSVERTIPASPQEIFDLLADPRRHPEIDGSGLLREARSSKTRLYLGGQFGMAMRAGLPYSVRNTVVEFEEDRVIAWKTHATGFMERFIGGRVWRYELWPTEGGTLVRQTWDMSQEAAFSRPVVRRMAGRAGADMEATLERMQQRFAG